MRVRERFTSEEYLPRLAGGDPVEQKEVFIETVQKVSTRVMGMQIPHSMVPEIPFQNPDRRAWAVVTGYYPAIVRMAWDRDSGRQHPDRPPPFDSGRTAEILNRGSGGIHKGQKRHKDLRSAP